MSKPIALIVDDEPDLRELLEITLQRMNIKTISVATYQDALTELKKRIFNICLTDMCLPDGDGLHLVKHLQANYPHIPVAVISAHGNMETAITALKKGAFDFIAKPLDLQILRNLVQTALKPIPSTEQEPHVNGEFLLGKSVIMDNLRKKISKISKSQAPIYISGASGAGKELVARLIHESGPRAKKPFIPVNCGAISKDLMESEFFGHKKGSFTGAHQDKLGFFQAAEGGTLFLDEVGELTLEMQVKLLRAIQAKAIRSVGSTVENVVDVRILSATHKNLRALVGKQQFREDLFYRINVIEVEVPSLKERLDDIPLLVEHILNKLSIKNEVIKPNLHPSTEKMLEQYDFPGNVRELENILERALTLCENHIILPIDLQLPNGNAVNPDITETIQANANQQNPFTLGQDSLEDYLDNLAKETIVKALECTRWSKTDAAKLLGISLRTLRYRLKKLKLE